MTERERHEGPHMHQQSPDAIAANPMSYPPYHAAYREVVTRGLIEGQALPVDMQVALIHKKRLSARQLQITERDKREIAGITQPGKSASIFHTADLSIASLTMLNRAAQSEDALYVLTQGELAQTGFVAYYAPTRHHPLHVRIIATEFDSNGQTPRHYTIALRDVLRQHKVVQPRRRRTS